MKWEVDESKPWFKEWWPNNCPKNIQFNVFSCGDFFDKQRAKYFDEIFMTFLETEMTYDEAGNYIDALATSLYRLGLRKGDSLAVLLPNCFQYVLSFYACMKIGVIVIPLNPNMKKLQIIKLLKLTQPSTIIIANYLWKEILKDLIPNIKFEFVIYTDILDFVKNKRAIQREYGKIPHSRVDFPNAIRLLDLAKSLVDLPKINISSINDIAVYIPTAGTTGEPKICELSHFNLMTNAQQCSTWLGGEDPGIGNLGVIPLYHPFGITCIINTTIAMGGWMLLFPNQPSEEQLLIEIHNAHAPKGFLFFGPEILFKRIIAAITFNDYLDVWKKIKFGISTAYPVHSSVQKEFLNKMGGTLVESYGLTEASPIVSIGNLVNETRENCLGLPLPGTEWGIFDPINFKIGPIEKFGKDHIGEICLSGPQVMNGYLNSLKATQDILKEFNNKIWLRTGDLGYMNEDGTIILTERKQGKKKKTEREHMFSYLVDVEKFVLQHELVSDTAVLGLPPANGELGKITKIWITLKSGQISKISSKKFSNWIEKNMPEYKLETNIEFIKPIPKSEDKLENKRVLGKIQKEPIKAGELQKAKIQK